MNPADHINALASTEILQTSQNIYVCTDVEAGLIFAHGSLQWYVAIACACVYICVCVCVCVCISVCVYISVGMCVYLRVYYDGKN